MKQLPYYLPITSLARNKVAIALLLSASLTACSSTSNSPAQADSMTNQGGKSQSLASEQRAYQHAQQTNQCEEHANRIANHAESIGSTAQYLAAAKAMNNCVSGALSNKEHQYNSQNNNQAQQDKIMKMMAVATLNFIKAGDTHTASREVERFKRVYPNQDLYFADYTSFLDTATALLSSQALAAEQLSSLNISRSLRDEIERKNYWLSH